MNRLKPGASLIIFRIIFYACSVYFFLMGLGLIFFPYLLVKGIAGTEVSPVVIGMLRGSGGAIIPYSLLYYLTLKRPRRRSWGLVVIALANILAILLDLGSVLSGEYQLSYAMMDLPVEILSLIGIAIIVASLKMTDHTSQQAPD